MAVQEEETASNESFLKRVAKKGIALGIIAVVSLGLAKFGMNLICKGLNAYPV